MDDKVKGTYMISQLIQDRNNLAYFLEHNTMLTALTRILNEERQKSVQLVTYLLEIFYVFSNFSQLHHILIQNKIGDMTMRVIDLEHKRYDLKMKEEKGKKISSRLVPFLKQQERALHVCFFILLNLAEDTSIEVKMVNRGIVKYLMKALERRNPDREHLDELHHLVLAFLKKLALFRDNKTTMVENQIAEVLMKFVGSDNQDLVYSALSLVYNLSFDPDFRAQCVSVGMLPALAQPLQLPLCLVVALRLLYHFSLDAPHIPLFVGTPIIPLLVQYLVRSPKKVDRELVAVLINLANHEECATIICQNDHVYQLVRKAQQTNDPLILKILRNVTQFESPAISEMFRAHIFDLLTMVKQRQDSHDLLLELLCIINNLSFPDIHYSDLIVQHGLVDLCIKNLMPGFAEDDVVLEIVMLMGILVSDPNAAPLFADSRLLRLLHDTLTEKQEDEEIVLQIVFTVSKFLLHADIRHVIYQEEQILHALLELVDMANPIIRKVVNDSLDILVACEEGAHVKVMSKRFGLHNREWVQYMEEMSQHQGGYEPPPHLHVPHHGYYQDEEEHGWGHDEESVSSPPSPRAGDMPLMVRQMSSNMHSNMNMGNNMPIAPMSPLNPEDDSYRMSWEQHHHYGNHGDMSPT
eukprot:TRINITY_DN1665_c0_g1_i2.p1 TRINITY_DN1665_c0_g1~~TRINITY_DN1665_c0_g1_i2.p1  ORF type:complete len:727 (+),score=154.37 TRINITY_DN1665_c0_g1_i2:273-2183(+)